MHVLVMRFTLFLVGIEIIHLNLFFEIKLKYFYQVLHLVSFCLYLDQLLLLGCFYREYRLDYVPVQEGIVRHFFDGLIISLFFFIVKNAIIILFFFCSLTTLSMPLLLISTCTFSAILDIIYFTSTLVSVMLFYLCQCFYLLFLL